MAERCPNCGSDKKADRRRVLLWTGPTGFGDVDTKYGLCTHPWHEAAPGLVPTSICQLPPPGNPAELAVELRKLVEMRTKLHTEHYWSQEETEQFDAKLATLCPVESELNKKGELTVEEQINDACNDYLLATTNHAWYWLWASEELKAKCNFTTTETREERGPTAYGFLAPYYATKPNRIHT